MKLTLPAASALLCLSAALPAQAGPVLFIAPSITDFGEYSNVDAALGARTSMGWHFERLPVLIEASYMRTGQHDITDDPVSLSLQYEGGDFSVGGFPYRNRELGLDTWAKAGYYYGRTRLETNSGDQEDSNGGFASGLGVAWKFTDWAALRLDVTAYFGVSDFSGINRNEESTLWSTTAGLMLTIPSGSREESRRPAPPVAAAEPAPAVPTAAEPTADAAAQAEPDAAAAEPESDAVRVTPVVEPATSPAVAQAAPAAPVAAPPAAPVVAAAPAAPAVSHPSRASQLEPGLRVTLKRDTPLLTRPLVGAQVDGVMPKSTDAELSHRVVNANGAWWFIRSDRLAGWVPEEALLRIQ